MFKLSVLTLSTLGYLVFLINTARLKAAIAPFVWACLIVLITYGFSIFGALSIGATTAVSLGLVAGLVSLWLDRARLSSRKHEFAGLIVWALPIVIYAIAIPKDFMFLLWDEVGGWARSQKLIYNTDALLNANSPFSLRSYPPGQQIFQYVLTKYSFWTEKNLLLAQNVFIFSALSACAGALIKRPALSGLVYLCSIPLIYFFKFDYNTIYCDPLVAAVFAGCLGLALSDSSGESAQGQTTPAWVMAICCCGFVLLKDVAQVFLALVFFVYAVTHFQVSARSAHARVGSRILAMIRSVGFCALTMITIVLSWKWYVSVIGTAKTDFIRLTLDGFMQEPYRQRAGLTITAFIDALLKPDYLAGSVRSTAFGLSLMATLLATTGLNLITIVFGAKTDRIKLALNSLAMLGGAVAYLLFLLWLYLTYFTEYEGTRLASFDRYSMTYVVAWVTVSGAWLIASVTRRVPLVLGLAFTVVLGATLLIAAPAKFYADLQRTPLDQDSFEKRKLTQQLSDQVRPHLQPGDKVYFIAQNSNGFERHLFDYAMLPNPPNDCWSVGEKYNAGDVWTCQQPLGLLIKDYAYLAVYHADDRFWHDNASLLANKGQARARGIYKILKTADGRLQLELVSD